MTVLSVLAFGFAVGRCQVFLGATSCLTFLHADKHRALVFQQLAADRIWVWVCITLLGFNNCT